MVGIIKKTKKVIFKILKNNDLENLSDIELLTLMRINAHRIEKSFYTGKYRQKSEYYEKCAKIIKKASSLIRDEMYRKCPSFLWSLSIADYVNKPESFLKKVNKVQDVIYYTGHVNEVITALKKRRSIRIWKSHVAIGKLIKIANEMISFASFAAPSSSNRQACRCRIIWKAEEKKLLKHLKEVHVLQAPVLIFVGMDKRVYTYDDRYCLYLDAGAFIMQMLNYATLRNIGTCWNHFGNDFLNSRKKNKVYFNIFKRSFSIPDYIEPIAIICVGIPAFYPPQPARISSELIFIGKESK